ncbi:peptidoglycan-binding protein [Afifella sp. H1R]|uniref:peptidoglycan-binding protein n=1 Tax=Afifella sp. H1R TaxID=2908841 RepID=UPI001F25E648|nr:peptidoglycan-binding protein [Afifella sp. H1R]MCF1502214.1 peptidoglycan-binding protein [Afifella sp. H1R]
MLTEAQLRAVVGRRASAAILRKVAASGDILARFDLAQSHRLAQFLAQIAHESARFRTTTEYASGAAYEGREDLGNTEKGDGVRFKGHGLIQTTGRYNHRKQTAWLRANGFPSCPDFEVEPDKASDFPWALLGAVWYWQSRDLSAYADRGDIEMITRRINGGLNGYQDRIDLYVRFALVILGYELTKGAVKRFQAARGLTPDDIAGAKTRAELHRQLVILPPVAAAEPVQETDMPIDESIYNGEPNDVVRAVQGQLKAKNYPVGYVDGRWGNLTRDAVRAFRADNGLADGRLDAELLATLVTAKSRPVSNDRAAATESELKKTSRIAWGSWVGKIGAAVTGIVGAGGLSAEVISMAGDQMSNTDIGAAIDTARTIGTATAELGPWGLVVAGAVLAFRVFAMVSKARLDDERTSRTA